MLTPIPTRYAGCHFRSRLEARWAVFFDHLGIRWEYEPQGYLVGCDWSSDGPTFQMHTAQCRDDSDPDNAHWSSECACPTVPSGPRPYLPDFRLPDMDLWVEVKGSDESVDWTLLGDAVDGANSLPMLHPGVDGEHRRVGGSWGVLSTLGSGYGPTSGAALLVLGDIPRSDALTVHPLLICQKGVTVNMVYWCNARKPWGWWDDTHLWMWEEQADHYDSSWGDRGPDAWRPVHNGGHRPLSVHGYVVNGPYHTRVRYALDAARSARFEHGQQGAT